MTYKEISSKQLSEIREILLEQQGSRCAICEEPLGTDKANQHVDHQHCFKSEQLGVAGCGLIRGVLCRNCNALEGKVWNNIHRYGKTDGLPVESRIRWLERLLAYYNANYSHSNPTLHPSEKRPEKLGKQEYNRIIKYYKSLPEAYKQSGELRDIPKYTGRWSPKLKDLHYRMTSGDGGGNG